MHRNNDHKSCLEVAFPSPLEISRVLFVVRFFVWLVWVFFLFGFGVFLGGWRLVCLTFFNRGYFNDFASVSSMALQTVKSVLLRDGTGLVTVAGRGLSEAGAAFPNRCHVTPSEAPSFWFSSCVIFDKVMTQSFVWPRLGEKNQTNPKSCDHFCFLPDAFVILTEHSCSTHLVENCKDREKSWSK